MTEEEKKRLHETLVKPVGKYTPEETEFVDRMMREHPIGFAEVLEEEVQALRQVANILRDGISSE